MGKKKQYKTDGTEDFDAEALSPDMPELGAEHDASKDSDSKKNSEKESVEPILGGDSASEITDPTFTSLDADSPSGDDEGKEGEVAPTSEASDQGTTDGEVKKSEGDSELSAPTPAPGIDTTATEDMSTSSTGEAAEGDAKPDAAAQSPEGSSDSTSIGAPSDLSEIAPVAGGDADKSADGVEAEAPKAEAEPELAAAHSEAEPAVAVAPEAMDTLKDGANKVGPALKKFADFDVEFDKLEAEAKARFAFARQKATEFVAAMEAIFTRG